MRLDDLIGRLPENRSDAAEGRGFVAGVTRRDVLGHGVDIEVEKRR